jgi:hypothetical protein
MCGNNTCAVFTCTLWYILVENHGQIVLSRQLARSYDSGQAIYVEILQYVNQ